MAGFRSLARQVRDPRLLAAQQRSSLRRCLERFAPYGHRATWHHLCERNGFSPDDRHPPQARLVAALEELEEARAVWLTYEAEFAARRKREKHEGIRRPTTLDDWHRRTWGGFGAAWCEDPAVHPKERLSVVLRQLIAALAAPPGTGCPVCGLDRIAWRDGLHHTLTSGPLCTECGIVVPAPVLTPEVLRAARESRYALR